MSDITWTEAEGLQAGLDAIRGGAEAVLIGGSMIGPDAVKEILEAARGSTTLKHLLFWECPVGDDGARALATELQANTTTLTSLYFLENGIGADGARALVTALETSSSLVTLEAWDNHIGNDGARALATALKANTTLINP